VQWARGAGRVLDTGCGSSVNVQSLNRAIGMDRDFSKLRFLRRYEIPLVNASATALPFKDGSFDCVISSQVIEHMPYDESIFSEMCRVLRAGGTLILNTEDYATVGARTVESIRGIVRPAENNDAPPTQYTLEQLREILTRHGIAIEETAYIAGIEMILRCRKGEVAGRATSEVRAVASTAA
jgi:ubiquinone/menaquinone biosynthesis C-methylase UbiE